MQLRVEDYLIGKKWVFISDPFHIIDNYKKNIKFLKRVN